MQVDIACHWILSTKGPLERGGATNMGSKISKNWLTLIKIFKNSSNFGQNLGTKWANWYMNGYFFLEQSVFVCVHFQSSQPHIPTKSNLSTPLPIACQHEILQSIVLLFSLSSFHVENCHYESETGAASVQ